MTQENDTNTNTIISNVPHEGALELKGGPCSDSTLIINPKLTLNAYPQPKPNP